MQSTNRASFFPSQNLPFQLFVAVQIYLGVLFDNSLHVLRKTFVRGSVSTKKHRCQNNIFCKLISGQAQTNAVADPPENSKSRTLQESVLVCLDVREILQARGLIGIEQSRLNLWRVKLFKLSRIKVSSNTVDTAVSTSVNENSQNSSRLPVTIEPGVQQVTRPAVCDARRHVAHRMDAFSELLGGDHAAAAVIAQPPARDWLRLSSAPPRPTARQRHSSICIVSDNATLVLSPCFLLNSRFALCTVHSASSPLPPPLSVAHSSHSSAPWYIARPSPVARAVVDLLSNTVVEAHRLPGRGILYRALVAGNTMDRGREQPSIILFASPAAPAAPHAVFHVNIRRHCNTCEPLQRNCTCPPVTSLQSVSPPPQHGSDPISPRWLAFAEKLHVAFHGSFAVTTTVTTSRGNMSMGICASLSTSSNAPTVHYVVHPSAQQNVSITINDPRISTMLTFPTTSQAGPSPRPLLPRPDPTMPPTSSTM